MASLKKAIDAKCKACCYDPMDTGTWREQSERCVVKSCPLWEVRPITIVSINAIRKTNNSFNNILDTLEDAIVGE